MSDNRNFGTSEKSIPEHSWAHRIKDVFSNRYKHAHNSIRNPIYTCPHQKNFPKKRVPPESKRIKITVIGDRVTKEFIYCANIVKGLYKYKKKSFRAPEIRAVTTVEWPSVWNELKLRFGGLAYCLTSSVAVLINDQILGGDKELKQFLETKYTYHLSLDYYKECVTEFAKYINGSERPCAYMNISIDNKHIGTLIFMLYSDHLPLTCENFLRLCKETKGGYSGTPIHRIVKDGWIQGGGFGLKNTPLCCENFIVPHDRRGVLGMANAGRHMDCSTQFFVLLQPAPWMAKKFVAFGQLIEGKETLDKIEAVPTWYESPTLEITIYKAGIFNMECHYVPINKGTHAYLHSHVEDLNALKELMWENLLEKVFLTAELREVERLREEGGEGDEPSEEGAGSVRETLRFNRKKEDIEKQLETTKLESTRAFPDDRPASDRHTTSPNAENNAFDVESYDPEYENEETEYRHQSLPPTPSLIVKPQKPYYLALTDVPYPGEKDSHFDLRRFLQGDYCLESDLQDSKPKEEKHHPLTEVAAVSSDLFDIDDFDVQGEEEEDSEYENEVRRYVQANVDRVSFAGDIIKKIAKGKAAMNMFDGRKKSELITDDNNLRKIRFASIIKQQNVADLRDKLKVSLDPSAQADISHEKIKRRQTGFIQPEDLAKIQANAQEVEDDYDVYIQKRQQSRQVSISVPFDDKGDKHEKIRRRQTGFFRPGDVENYRKTSEEAGTDEGDDYGDDDDEIRKGRISKVSADAVYKKSVRRPGPFMRESGADADDEPETEHRTSVLVRLFDDVTNDEDPPTLKDYKPISEAHPKNVLLTFSSNFAIKSDENTREKYLRHSLTVNRGSFDHVLTLQHGKKVSRKISSDYVKTIDQIEHRLENSIRSIEFAKKRPAMSVADYQEKNKKYQDDLKVAAKKKAVGQSKPHDVKKSRSGGLRLPGDSPLYSDIDIRSIKSRKSAKSVTI